MSLSNIFFADDRTPHRLVLVLAEAHLTIWLINAHLTVLQIIVNVFFIITHLAIRLNDTASTIRLIIVRFKPVFLLTSSHFYRKSPNHS